MSDRVGRVGQQLGNYRLVRLLGRGGFAEVYLGEHIRLGTQAAIKVLHTQLASGDDMETFHNEARTIARLEHPHIVRILDFDISEGTPFLVMHYASNGTLRQLHPKNIPLPLDTVISYVKQVADALQYAHEEKLVHRDVKPENMLLGRRNEILLSDFGIATMTQSSRYQNTQEVAGTVAYMAPEQVQGKPRPASDQYALGIVIYEWLSGNRPFQGSFSEVATQHMFVPPQPLREKIPSVLPAVEQVVLTALEKDPHKRFANMRAFANALEQASNVGIVRDTQPLAPQAIAPTIISLATPAPATIVPLAPSAPLEEPPPRVTIPPRSVVPPQPPVPTVPPPRGTPPINPPIPPTAVVKQRAVFTAPIGAAIQIYRGHAGPVEAIAWSPDSTRVVSASDDKTVQVWDAHTGQQLFAYSGHSECVCAVKWSPDGRYIASGSQDSTVHIWDAAIGRPIFIYEGHNDSVWTLGWSPDGTRLASGSQDGTVQVWDPRSGAIIFNVDTKSKEGVWSLDWCPDSMHIAFGSNDNRVQVWNVIRKHQILTYRNHSDHIWTVTWSPDSTRIASGSDDKTVQVWDAVRGNTIFTQREHADYVTTVTWAPNGKYIASGGEDYKVQVWNVVRGNHVFTYRGHSDNVLAVAWSPDGTRIASASDDGTVQIWAAPSMR